MKLTPTQAYWSFVAVGMVSAAIALVLYLNVATPASALRLGLIMLTGTLLYGMLIALPTLRDANLANRKLENRAAELEVAAITDPLTGLYNRRYFGEALREYFAEFTKAGAPLALLTLDLDHFKSVNDTYGHDAGDIVLKQLAERMRNLVRDHDVIARVGGEEFCILAPFARPEQIRPFAERICRMVEEMRVDVGTVILRPTISIGVASSSESVANTDQLIKLSDQRLYEAKQRGRNRVCA